MIITIIKKIININLFLLLLVSANQAYAEELILEGKVYNRATMKPVDMASIIIIEAKVKAITDMKGNYRIVIPEPGEYTVFVKSEGLKNLELKIRIDKILKGISN